MSSSRLSLGRLKEVGRLFSSEQERFVAQCHQALKQSKREFDASLFSIDEAQGMLTSELLRTGRERPWPMGLTRQMDPLDSGFVPNGLTPAYSNVLHRNWTTIGLPGWSQRAVVDPAGWLTPFENGPSVAVWIGDSRKLYTMGPLPGWGLDEGWDLTQERIGDFPMVRTTAIREDVSVQLDAFPAVVNGRIVVGLTVRLRNLAPAARPLRVAFAIRPANLEGAVPVFNLGRSSEGIWQVNGNPFLFLPRRGDQWLLSTEAEGDVYGLVGGMLRQGQLRRGTPSALEEVNCAVGQATACELYRVNLSPGDRLKRTAYVIRDEGISELLRRSSATRLFSGVQADFKGLLRAGSEMELPVHGGTFGSARTTLLAHCDTDQVASSLPIDSALAIREAVPVLAALNRLGFGRRVAQNLQNLFRKQKRTGAWGHSEGSVWATGQVLWALLDHVRLTGNQRLLARLFPAVSKAGAWIDSSQKDGVLLGKAGSVSDHWDAIWACAGLREAAKAASMLKKTRDAERFLRSHGEMLEVLREGFGDHAIPAGADRAMDSEAVTVLSAVWPLNLLSAREASVQKTLAWLQANSVARGACYSDAGVSGFSPSRSACLAQVALMAGLSGVPGQLDALVRDASPTGTWPSSYLLSGNGVGADGDHAWAAAEFVMLQRNLLLWEEGGVLHLCRGTDERWWQGRTMLRDVPTRFGHVDLDLEDGCLRLEGRWRQKPNRVIWHKPEGPKGVLVVNGSKKTSKKSELAL